MKINDALLKKFGRNHNTENHSAICIVSFKVNGGRVEIADSLSFISDCGLLSGVVTRLTSSSAGVSSSVEDFLCDHQYGIR